VLVSTGLPSWGASPASSSGRPNSRPVRKPPGREGPRAPPELAAAGRHDAPEERGRPACRREYSGRLERLCRVQLSRAGLSRYTPAIRPTGGPAARLTSGHAKGRTADLDTPVRGR